MTQRKFTDQQIKLLVAEGKTRKEIARTLGINDATAGRHLARLGLRLKDLSPERRSQRAYQRRNAGATNIILNGQICRICGVKQISNAFRLHQSGYFETACKVCERNQNRQRLRITGSWVGQTEDGPICATVIQAGKDEYAVMVEFLTDLEMVDMTILLDREPINVVRVKALPADGKISALSYLKSFLNKKELNNGKEKG